MTEKDEIVSVVDAGEREVFFFQCETGNYFADGVCSKNSDLYGEIIDGEKDRKPEDKAWRIYARGCYKKDTGDKPPQFTPEELELPDLLEKTGETPEGKPIMSPISWWPERFSVRNLELSRTNPAIADAAYLFATQKRNNPLDLQDQRAMFPLDRFTTISRANFKKNVVISYHSVTVDTAQTQNARSDYTCLTCVGWDKGGRPYVHDIRHGRFYSDEIVWHFFDLLKQHKPLTVTFEKTGFVDGLMPSIHRAMDTGKFFMKDLVVPGGSRVLDVKNLYTNIQYVKRETTVSKADRIASTLQPWYNSGELRFLDDLSCLEHLKQELNKFPRYKTDDIIDTLADQFQNKDWFGRLAPRPTVEQTYDESMNRLLGITGFWDEDMTQNATHVVPNPYFNRTGGL